MRLQISDNLIKVSTQVALLHAFIQTKFPSEYEQFLLNHFTTDLQSETKRGIQYRNCELEHCGETLWVNNSSIPNDPSSADSPRIVSVRSEVNRAAEIEIVNLQEKEEESAEFQSTENEPCLVSVLSEIREEEEEDVSTKKRKLANEAMIYAKNSESVSVEEEDCVSRKKKRIQEDLLPESTIVSVKSESTSDYEYETANPQEELEFELSKSTERTEEENGEEEAVVVLGVEIHPDLPDPLASPPTPPRVKSKKVKGSSWTPISANNHDPPPNSKQDIRKLMESGRKKVRKQIVAHTDITDPSVPWVVPKTEEPSSLNQPAGVTVEGNVNSTLLPPTVSAPFTLLVNNIAIDQEPSRYECGVWSPFTTRKPVNTRPATSTTPTKVAVPRRPLNNDKPRSQDKSEVRPKCYGFKPDEGSTNIYTCKNCGDSKFDISKGIAEAYTHYISCLTPRKNIRKNNLGQYN